MSVKRVITFIFAVVLTVLIFLFLFCPVRTEADEHYSQRIIPKFEKVNAEVCREKQEAFFPELPAEPTRPEVNDGYFIPWCEQYITNDEFRLVAKTVYAEAGNQSLECQRLVAVVIFNRLASDKFPDNVHDVIYAQNAFEVTQRSDWDELTFTDQAELATYLAIATYPFEPKDLYFFRDSHYHGFGYRYLQDGAMYFNTEGNEHELW